MGKKAIWDDNPFEDCGPAVDGDYPRESLGEDGIDDDGYPYDPAWILIGMGFSDGLYDDDPLDEGVSDELASWDDDDEWCDDETLRSIFPNMDDDSQDEEEDLSGYDIHDSHQLGRLGERLALRYLKRRHFKILERNYRCEYGEADLICFHQGTVVLVEVKTRLGTAVRPEEAVDTKKVNKYRWITLKYLMDNEWFNSVRLDVVAINVENEHKAHVHHFVGVCEWES